MLHLQAFKLRVRDVTFVLGRAARWTGRRVFETIEVVAAAGKHLFSEKPLARNLEEVLGVVAAVRQHGVTLKLGANLRYFRNVLKASELLNRHSIGKLLFLRSWIGHDGWNHQNWYGQAEVAGGGTFLDNGCHVFDLIRLFMGGVKSCVGSVQTALWPVTAAGGQRLRSV